MYASDRNYNMPFLRNEFSKIFKDLFTMTHFSYIFELVGSEMSSRKLLKLNGPLSPNRQPKVNFIKSDQDSSKSYLDY